MPRQVQETYTGQNMLVIFIRKREALMRPPGAVALAGLLLGVETRHLLANWGEE